MRIYSTLIVLLCFPLLGCDPPAEADAKIQHTGYYAQIIPGATGDELKAQLHNLIDDHEQLNYRELWDALCLLYTSPSPRDS